MEKNKEEIEINKEEIEILEELHNLPKKLFLKFKRNIINSILDLIEEAAIDKKWRNSKEAERLIAFYNSNL